MGKTEQSSKRLEEVRGFIDDLYGHDLHAKRVDALAGAALGVMAGASLAVSMIGQALAQARGLVTKHAVKQVDRLLKSNTSKTRTHSLFRQGCMLYKLIPNMPERRLEPLMEAFAKAVSQTSFFNSLVTIPK